MPSPEDLHNLLVPYRCLEFNGIESYIEAKAKFKSGCKYIASHYLYNFQAEKQENSIRLSAFVHARLKDDYYFSEALIDEDKIISTTCACKSRSKSKCDHIAALLLLALAFKDHLAERPKWAKIVGLNRMGPKILEQTGLKADWNEAILEMLSKEKPSSTKPDESDSTDSAAVTTVKKTDTKKRGRNVSTENKEPPKKKKKVVTN